MCRAETTPPLDPGEGLVPAVPPPEAGPAPGSRRTPVIRGLLLVACLAAFSAAGCREEEPPATAGPDLIAMEADQVVIGMEHALVRDGLRRAMLRADTAWFLEDSTLVRLRPVEATFFDEAGREVSDLTAREGVYDMRTGDMEATRRVVVRSRTEFQRLETERLRYDAEADLLRTDTAFVLYREGSTITGRALVSDPGLDSTQVRRPSAVVENPEEIR